VIRALVLLLRLLLVLLIVRLVLRGIAGWLRPSAPAPAPSPGSLELVRDRVCGTYLPRDRALTVSVAGREQHFCSVACRDRAALSAAS
jgi:hypothetical protein